MPKRATRSTTSVSDMQNESINENVSEKESQPYIIWDTYEIIKHQAEFLREEDESLSEDEAWDQAAQDDFLFEHEWDYVFESLEEKMKEINEGGFWRVEVDNFGWRNLNGWKKIQTDSAKKLLQEVLPDTDCTFHIFVVDDAEAPAGKMLTLRNWHHDSPMGNEWYEIRAISAEAFYGEEEDEEDED
jgi:hypothetical protein